MEGTVSYDLGAPRRVAHPSSMGVYNMGLAVAQLPQREAIPVLLTTSAATNTPEPSYSPLADVPERRSDLAGVSADSQEGSSSGLVAATLFPLRRAVQTLRAAVTQVLANICVSRDNVDSVRRSADRRRQAQGSMIPQLLSWRRALRSLSRVVARAVPVLVRVLRNCR
jgi:hypothetical protein